YCQSRIMRLRSSVLVMTGGWLLYAQSAAPPVWTLQLDRTIGGGGGAARLSSVGGVFVDSRHNTIVAQPDSLLLRVFRPDGELLTRIGKRGVAPGEFTTLDAIGAVGDTLF